MTTIPKIYIPTRGGKEPQLTFNALPEFLRERVVFISSTPIETLQNITEIVVGDISIGAKRQYIQDLAHANSEFSYISVDADIRKFLSVTVDSRGSAIDNYDINEDSMTRWLAEAHQILENYVNIFCVSEYPGLFSNEPKYTLGGTMKFRLHKTSLCTESRYDRVPNYIEDLDFNIQQMQRGYCAVKLKGITTKESPVGKDPIPQEFIDKMDLLRQAPRTERPISGAATVPYGDTGGGLTYTTYPQRGVKECQIAGRKAPRHLRISWPAPEHRNGTREKSAYLSLFSQYHN